MSAALGVSAQVEDVELRLLLGEITVRGIHAAPAAESDSSLDIDALTLHWRWIDLMRGIALVDGRVAGLDVTIDLHRPWPAVRDAASELPPRLRSLAIESGSVAVVVVPDSPPIVALSDLHGKLKATDGRTTKTETMTTHFSVTAQAGEGGSFELEGSVAPADPASSWSLSFALDRFDLRPLNPLFEKVLEMDVEHGWLSLDGRLSVGLGRMRGQLRPRFEALQLLGRGERRVRHPMAEALFGELLSGADLPIDIDQTLVSSEESMRDALADVVAMDLMRDLIQRGFVRRLDTLDDYESAVGRVEVDFPRGRLSFFDVTLSRIGGAVSRPFIAIARLDIVVAPSAVDREVVTYKSITLHEPALTFVTGETPEQSQLTFDPDWQAKVDVLPYPTDRVEIIDGRVEYLDDTTNPPTSLIISELDLLADNLGCARVDGRRRCAPLAGSARVMNLSALQLALEFTPGVVNLDAAIQLQLDPLPLPELNQLIEGRLGIDVTTGTLALVANLDVHDERLRGTVTPAFRDVRVLGVDEMVVKHPIRELMLERRLHKLDGTTLTLDHRIRTNTLRELPPALLSAVRRAG